MKYSQFPTWGKILAPVILGSTLFSSPAQAETALLSAEQAFPVSVISTSQQQAELSWQIPDNYYLYQHKIEVRQGNQPVTFELPPAEDLYDDNYGHTQVYYQQLKFQIPTQAGRSYQVSWQGCAKDRICYPPQTIQFKTDLSGLVQFEAAGSGTKRLLDLNTSSLQHNTLFNTADSSESTADEISASANTQTEPYAAQDQKWSAQLLERSLGYGLLLFFGLGILLAFTPCSLPMLPILT